MPSVIVCALKVISPELPSDGPNGFSGAVTLVEMITPGLTRIVPAVIWISPPYVNTSPVKVMSKLSPSPAIATESKVGTGLSLLTIKSFRVPTAGENSATSNRSPRPVATRISRPSVPRSNMYVLSARKLELAASQNFRLSFVSVTVSSLLTKLKRISSSNGVP